MKRIVLVSIFLVLATSLFAEKAERANWFFVNYTAYKHKIHITINGKKLITIDNGSGFDSKPSPLKEGKNQVFVRFEQKLGEIGKPGLGSKARIFLSPNMMVGNKPLPGIELTDVENYCECNIEIVIKDRIPQSFKYVRKDWVSDKKKIPLYEEQIEKRALSEIWEKEMYKSWTPEGNTFSEEIYLYGKLNSAKYYCPDGKVGAEVKNSKGVIKEWYGDGTVAMEVPVENGLRNGVMKEYSGEGKVVSQIQFKDGEEVTSKQKTPSEK